MTEDAYKNLKQNKVITRALQAHAALRDAIVAAYDAKIAETGLSARTISARLGVSPDYLEAVKAGKMSRIETAVFVLSAIDNVRGKRSGRKPRGGYVA